MKILKRQSTPVSTKYELDANMGAKVSLVLQKKRAVMLYETLPGDEDMTGPSIEFLSCK